MIKFRALALLIFLSYFSFGQIPNFEWNRTFHGNNNEDGWGITIDEDGNVWTTGFYRGLFDSDPGADSSFLEDAAQSSVFIHKMSPTGELLWAGSFDGTNQSFGYSITSDKAGHVFLTGYFSGRVDFDPTQLENKISATSGNGSDAFLVKLDTDGNLIMVKVFESTGGIRPRRAALDMEGDIYIIGNFSGLADFNPNSGEINRAAVGSSSDLFILKLDPSGNFKWVNTMGGEASDFAFGLEVDQSNNVVISGRFEGTVDFDPSSGIDNISSVGRRDIFVQKFDSEGNSLWVKTRGSNLDDNGNKLAIDEKDNIFVCGSFCESVTFGSETLTSLGNQDGFIEKLDPNGNSLWVKQIAGSNFIIAQSIAFGFIDNSIVSAGYFKGTANFNPEGTDFKINSAGELDIFITVIDEDGNFEWAGSLGGILNDFSGEVIAEENAFYLTGRMRDTADADPTVDQDMRHLHGDDMFVLKMTNQSAGIRAENKESQLFYPNPSTGNFNLDKNIQIRDLKVFTELGQEVDLESIKLSNNQLIMYVPKGVYFITGNYKNKHFAQKVIVY
jgi:hypothetical protein